jgi:hypothetical protein
MLKGKFMPWDFFKNFKDKLSSLVNLTSKKQTLWRILDNL